MADYHRDSPTGQSVQKDEEKPVPVSGYAPMPSASGRNHQKHVLRIVAVVMALAIVGVLGYVMLGSKKAAAPANTTDQQQTQSNQNKQTDTSAAASNPQTYKSTALNIEFTYPAGWKMKENADKTIITLTSPQTSYAKKDGTTANGVFTLRLRNGIVSDTMKQNIQNAVAMKDSEIIAYDQPTDQQRQYTNISEGGNGPNATFFIVSGGVAFKAGEAFGSNIDLEGAVYLFAGGYGTDNSDTLAFDAVPKATFEGSMYQQAIGIIKSMKIY